MFQPVKYPQPYIRFSVFEIMLLDNRFFDKHNAKISPCKFDHIELVSVRDRQLYFYGLDGIEDLRNAAMPMTIE